MLRSWLQSGKTDPFALHVAQITLIQMELLVFLRKRLHLLNIDKAIPIVIPSVKVSSKWCLLWEGPISVWKTFYLVTVWTEHDCHQEPAVT